MSLSLLSCFDNIFITVATHEPRMELRPQCQRKIDIKMSLFVFCLFIVDQ